MLSLTQDNMFACGLLHAESDSGLLLGKLILNSFPLQQLLRNFSLIAVKIINIYRFSDKWSLCIQDRRFCRQHRLLFTFKTDKPAT